MPSAKEHIKALVDELPEPAALEIERVLISLAAKHDEGGWPKVVSAAFASWFSDDEYEYPE